MNQLACDMLFELYVKRRLGHAYIFAGPQGVGKFETVMELARRVNCLKSPKGVPGCDCGYCQKAVSGNHPDIFVLEKPDDKTGIGIEQVRALIDRLEFRSLEAKLKVAVVKDAELIHEGAANAFLKTLEEPRPDTLLVLTTASPDSLLATIVSRCQMIRFAALPLKALADLLRENHGFKDQEALVLAAFSQGSLARARAMGADFLSRRRQVLDAFLSAADVESLVKLAGADRVRAHEALEIMLMFLKDCLMMAAGAMGAVVNLDCQLELRRFTGRFKAQELLVLADQLTDALKRLEGHQNTKVVLTAVKEMM